ncbi:LysR family transcriptional regulator [Agrobacterium rhizogenes]|uniref:LysR family transcriptional regulator n=1 Tax=Rhizobium rhizogenes TaxID=359 RepID=UPI001572B705|nr:LysR family transcriptional regulator [Rhizobium rhizogenes]NTH16748.1 LysR family transcriptional regulator [Rhizobium rhizogenes]
MPDQLRSMRVFATVVALGNFSAAGRQLGMSQTMVTKHITALENTLGIQLLRRTTQHVTATEAGERYAEACRRILEEVEEANSAAAAHQAKPCGLLRMSVPVTFGLRVVNPILGDFAKLHRDVTIDLELNDRRVDLLDDGWDLAVRVGRLNDSTMMAKKLVACPTFVCAAPAYLATHGTPTSVLDLKNHSCLGYSLSNVTNAVRWSFGANDEVVIDVSGPFRANNGDSVCAMAVAGLGLAYQPGFIVADDIRAGRLVAIELDHPTALLHAYALFPRANRQPAKVRAIVDFLIGRL